jgi:hypothetical protein
VSEDLPRVWLHDVKDLSPVSMTVALQDSVLLAAVPRNCALMAVDVRASKPADWRCGAVVSTRKPNTGTGTGTGAPAGGQEFRAY